MSYPYLKGGNAGKKLGRNGLVAVAIDKDKSSQYALRWTVDNLLVKGQTVILIHVLHKPTSASGGNTGAIIDSVGANKQQTEKQAKELFLTFHCFCTRKDVQCYDVTLEDNDISKAITEYVSHAAIENLVFGSSRHGFIRRLKTIDTPTAALKGASDFCTVYVISKTKISQVRNASRIAPFVSPILNEVNQAPDQVSSVSSSPDVRPKHTFSIREAVTTPRKLLQTRDFDNELIRSPFARARGLHGRLLGEPAESESDISFISSERPSVDRMSGLYDSVDSARTSRISTSSESSFGSGRIGSKASDYSSFQDFSSSSIENDDVEAEMRRLKLELQKTMEMYSTACKEALTAKQKATELRRWRIEEEQRIKESKKEEEAGKSQSEMDDEAVDASQRSGEFSSQKQKKAVDEDEEKRGANHYFIRYRKYSIDDIEEATENLSESCKIGEGGYGPVFKCYLDHTAVAVKVLRPDATQGRAQFQQEVEVLTCMRHPHLVLLLGACPEYGCLVYEYMANGSLEDRLFRRGNTSALSWQLRFRIAAEIATGLLFLHRTKPEPIVHRDLKPANILLDNNYVSKIGDVGLARLVPPSVADDVTQYRMTSAAGTFCYIDPEYQQTGMLGVKSDVYSFGIILLQIVTAKPAMGLTHSVQRAIDNGKFGEILDPKVSNWPFEEAMSLAKLGLQCSELRRKDRPDLDAVVLPQLNRLRELADESLSRLLLGG